MWGVPRDPAECRGIGVSWDVTKSRGGIPPDPARSQVGLRVTPCDPMTSREIPHGICHMRSRGILLWENTTLKLRWKPSVGGHGMPWDAAESCREFLPQPLRLSELYIGFPRARRPKRSDVLVEYLVLIVFASTANYNTVSTATHQLYTRI